MGQVYLIGAGPGDEELITVKAVRVLKKCDVVLYDRLSNDNLLKYLKDDAKLYYCGKKPGNHYRTQEETNDKIVELAKQGYTVGRIKGGDPYIFGRGGEEGLRLFKEGIDFEVIPGITSPIAVLNYSGIPTTQRDVAQSFHVYIGKTSGEHNIDWSVVSKNEGTQIFLMGLGKLEEIVDNLIKNDKDKNTPIAVIMKGTTSKQKKVIGTLNDIVKKVKDAKLESPCIIALGDVVNLNDKLNWYEDKPLFGLNICTTRSRAQSSELNEKILDLGGEVTEINTIKIVPTPSHLDKYSEKVSNYDYVVLTSVNAVDIFFQRLIELDIDIRSLKAEIIVIGKKTYEVVKERGIIPFAMSKHFIAESLFERMKEFIKKGDKILLPQSKISRPFLYDSLVNEGCLVDKIDIYDTVSGDVKCEKSTENSMKDVDIILFTSPSTVKNLISMVGIENIKDKEIISIGEITEAEIKRQGLNCHVCEECSVEGLIEKILEIKEKMKCSKDTEG